MNTRQILKVRPSTIAKARKAGARIVNLWITPFGVSSYEGRKRKGSGDYLYGVKAICDDLDLLCLVSENPEVSRSEPHINRRKTK